MSSVQSDLITKMGTAEDDYVIRKTKIIYEVGADATFEFENEPPIQVNKTLLGLQSKHFFHIFFESSTPDAKLKIKDFERHTFKTFLDCMFGLKEYSVFDALMIYPIAHKYDAKKCLKKCVSVLKPTEMTENVCLSLNLALFFECEELLNGIFDFFENQFGVVNVIVYKNFSDLLEPKAMSKLIEYVELDSYIWKIIYEWGNNYLESRKSNKDVLSLLIENNIFKKLSLSDFESVQSILDFHKITDRQLLNSEEVFDYLENNLFKKNDEKLPEKSCWVNIKRYDKITETFVFKNAFVISHKDWINKSSFNIFINRVCPNLPKAIISNFIRCKVRYNYREISQEKAETPSELPIKSSFLFSVSSTPPVNTFIPKSLGNNEPILNGSLCTSRKASSRAPFSFGSIDEIIENFNDLNPKTFSFPVPFCHQFSEIKSVEITYVFSFNCRILKTSISDNFVDSDQLHFTNDVIYSQNAKSV